ncbi:uncharacterized protein LOC142632613 [Castanea sativa]|uniref:uncharacterized protein LOC142632613 n=1 Tax=Castanea sativa TaxID=21020 RepID=UPI003F64E543
MNGDPARRNQNLHCQYHQERGHTIENCKNLWYHLEQLVKEGKLQQFTYRPNGHAGHAGSGTQGKNSSRPPLGTINVIFTTSGKTDLRPYQVMTVVRPLSENSNLGLKRAKVALQLELSFSENDNIGIIQPYDDALVVTLRIVGYDVRRVMVDQGSGAEIMYPYLYRGLGLKLKDLTSYDSPLVGFNGKMVIPMGQVKLPVQTGLEVVKVNFIMVDADSPYVAIVARPWLHAMGAVPSTLHLKVKYPFGDQVEGLIGSQSTARQCMMAAIRHQFGAGSSAS